MKPLTSHPIFRGPITDVQLARDGAWENAWRFSPDHTPDDSKWRSYFSGRDEIAFEAFFGAAFFGVRFTGEFAAVSQRASACVAAARSARNGGEFFAELESRTGLGAWGTVVDLAEIGAVNAWRSVGAHRLEPSSADAIELVGSLADSPLGRNRAHPKAIEFASASPVPHWFALPVSHAPDHAIDAALLAVALESIR